MRYKSMPIVTRAPSQAPDPAPPPSPAAPRAWWFDWLLTIPVLLLVPLILVPVLANGAVPSLAVSGEAVAGQQLVVDGSGFPRGRKLRLAWDGAKVWWLPSTKVNRDGTFRVTAVLPAGTRAGDHLLAARMVRNHDRGRRAREAMLASVTVHVVAAVAVADTPAPTPTASATATPTVRPTQTASPTPTAAQVATPPPTATPQPSEPPPPPGSGTVVGYGAGTVGGAGGRQLAVTTLADSGPGSLRAALEASGKRVVVFRVAGTIRLRSTINVTDPYLTVAGETAPAPGITVRDGGLLVRASEVILRHLRLRPGDQVDSPDDVDALTINGANGAVANVVVDHVTMLWGPDIGGLAVLGDVRNLTVQHSIMGEGLYLSAHSEGTAGEGGHSHAANVTQLDGGLAAPRRLTFWRNLFTTANTRIPRFQGAECVDVVNNVIYNWGRDAAHGNPRSLNLVNNWFRAGPETESHLFWKVQTSDVTPRAFSDAVYVAGNVADGFRGNRDEAAGVYAGSPRCGGLSAPAGDPAAAYAAVLDRVGAIAPLRDAVDRRLIDNVLSRSGRFVNGAGYPGPNPYWP
jgi:hypothetical protein